MSRRAKVRARVPTRSFFAARDGMTNEEIASKLGISRQAVSQTVQKALVKLRRELIRRRISAGDLF
ncbi:MAG TPA: sigma factor-like helix-turn-helix DNA-binding protein [Burkholderiales bacterium]|nr:sigma factor-like helix-turn-helix DNA-binding protein [Burkholderiaceae bacterium]HQR53158.1 sigma factor-like helix-turn-helix DNA-binding protein [Burkholderiales bacterium]